MSELLQGCGVCCTLNGWRSSAQRYLRRTLWQRWRECHNRSRDETKTHCLKLMGQPLMARDLDNQVAEIQIRLVVLNCYAAVGMPITAPVG
jgi:hypothetical protein